MKARGGNERRHEAYQVVVHVAREAEGVGGRGHDGRDERVDLCDRRAVRVQPLRRDAIERRVVQHDHCVGIQREPLEGEQRVVRLHDDVAAVLVVGEDRVRLDQLLREVVVDRLEHP